MVLCGGSGFSPVLLHSHGCKAPGGHLEPRKYCHRCHLVETAPPPGEAESAPCDDKVPGREASQSGQAP